MSEQRGTTTALPEDWGTILDTVGARLQEAIAAADARTPSEPTSMQTATRRTELEDLAARRHRLDKFAARAQTLATEVDTVLAAGEAATRQRLAEVESLRERLAAWAARAIG
jgi:hypothetical protein